MMEPSESASSTSTGTPAWKVALIPVLGAVLVWNLFGSKASGLAVQSVDPDTNVESSVSREADGTASTRSTETVWPQFALDDIVQHDPFALTGTLFAATHAPEPEAVVASNGRREPGSDESRIPRDDLAKTNPVKAIIHSSRGRAALVNSKIVQVGDELEAGIRIVEISDSGIVVEVTE